MAGHHSPSTVERHCDVAVIGGSAAGLAAALQLGRQRRSVIVIDADHRDALADERDEIRSHGGEVLQGRALRVGRAGVDQLRLELTGGHAVVAWQVLVATGTVDEPIGFRLADEDLDAAARPSGNEADWDHRYSGERLWSGNPNGTLVAEVGDLPPGRALDVGAGEGGDAVWLAEQGWSVTANDVTQRALDRIAAEAGARGLAIELLHADANVPGAFPSQAFDLVSAQYASIPRTPDHRGVANLLDAVAPGGTLLVVSHDLAPMRVPVDTAVQSRPFDPDAYVRVEDVAAALAEDPDWDIEVHASRPRPPGAASTHHVDDVVLRARRR